ncbi:MAG TPA: sensor histidine kinase [Candidatus Dormibacteraeota bacterium]|nr:sensor histidine kinase [Candidatus Dormibacteraeota bacterium]
MAVARWVVIGRVFMCTWFLFVVPSGLQVLESGHGEGQVGAIIAFTGWGLVWVWFWARALGHGQQAHLVGFVAMTVVVVMLSVLVPPPIDVGGVVVFAFIVAGVAFPLRTAIWVVLGLAVVQVALGFIRQESFNVQLSGLLNSVLVGGLGIGVRFLWLAYNELLAAREEIARLAVSEERLRFARDMHDVVGQGLAMIVLKSELAARQLPADADDSVRQELSEVVAVARKSLNDVREAVTGYRRPTLPGEISSARAALRTAGITFAVSDQAGAVPPDKDAVLAWCLREAVTNVVKHSGAARCELRLSRENGQFSMLISDDGRGATDLNGGSGIAGMRERVAMAGGTLDVTGDGGLSVAVKVPTA